MKSKKMELGKKTWKEILGFSCICIWVVAMLGCIVCGFGFNNYILLLSGAMGLLFALLLLIAQKVAKLEKLMKNKD